MRRWRCWVPLALVWPLCSASQSLPCPDAVRPRQAPLQGALRSGYFRIVEVHRSQAMECWLEEGGRALAAGRLDDARMAYLKALQTLKNDLEALLGLAAVAVRQGRSEEAQRRYREVLMLEPDNAQALTGLSVVLGEEPKLLAILERLARERPLQAEIHFALGNLYVRREDWAKAQSAYFEAFRLDKEIPDYAYNLAVSLDRLGKRDSARRFYELSLRLAQLRPHGFDPEAVRVRLHQLGGGGA